MDQFLEDEYREQQKEEHTPGTWSSMNFLQRGGVISGIAVMPFSYMHDPVGTYFGVASWTCFFLGYVSGNFWKIRHAMHFWWAMAAAMLIHCCTIPLFVYISRQIRDSHNGKGFIYLGFGLLIAEVLTVIFVLRHAALWLHKLFHTHRSELETRN